MTSFVDLTEMWQNHMYTQVGDTIHREKWSCSRVAEFCAYVCKYLGTSQLYVLYKFL